MHKSKERTLVVIKPDGIQRGMMGEIIKRLERIGLKLVAMKMVLPNEEIVRKHYLIDPEWLRKVGEKNIKAYLDKGMKASSDDPLEIGEYVLNRLIKYFTCGPVIAMVWQGLHSQKIVRKIVGSTEPLVSDVGTIRGDFVLDSYEMADIDDRAIRNLMHASGSIEDAEKEIDIWFGANEIINYKLVAEQILYDVNMDGLLE